MPINSKQNLIMRLGVIVLVITMLLTVFVGGTYAKYATMASTSDKGRVAVFTIDAPGLQSEGIEIFSTAYKGTGDFADQDTVKGDKNLVAPGTQGGFDIVINYTMDVAASYTFSFEEVQTPANANIPIIYSIDDGLTWHDTPELPALIEDNINTTFEPGSGQKVVKMLWKWAFNEDMQDVHQQSNDYDTDLGFDGQSEVTLNIGLNITQID